MSSTREALRDIFWGPIAGIGSLLAALGSAILGIFPKRKSKPAEQSEAGAQEPQGTESLTRILHSLVLSVDRLNETNKELDATIQKMFEGPESGPMAGGVMPGGSFMAIQLPPEVAEQLNAVREQMEKEGQGSNFSPLSQAFRPPGANEANNPNASIIADMLKTQGHNSATNSGQHAAEKGAAAPVPGTVVISPPEDNQQQDAEAELASDDEEAEQSSSAK